MVKEERSNAGQTLRPVTLKDFVSGQKPIRDWYEKAVQTAWMVPRN